MPLTPLQKQHGPWAKPSGVPGVEYTRACTADCQLPSIKTSTDLEWLRAVAADRDTGLTVRRAAESRLRKLSRAQSTNPTNQ